MSNDRLCLLPGGPRELGLPSSRPCSPKAGAWSLRILMQGNLDAGEPNLAGVEERVRFESLNVTDEEAVIRAVRPCEASSAH